MSVVISPSLALSATAPLTHPRIMWDDWCRRGTVAASGSAAGFPFANATDYLTYDFWRPNALPAWIDVEISTSEIFDCVLIGAHTLGTAGATVKVQYHDGADWADVPGAELLPATDRVIMFLFAPVVTDRARIVVTGSTVPSIGVVMFGEALVMQRPFYGGHTPVNFGRVTDIRPNRSEGGQWLGRSIRRAGVATDISFRHLTAPWMREKFEPFMLAARTYPFGFAWRPQQWPDEVALVWTGEDIRPQNMGIRDFMSVDFSVEGHIE